MSSVERRLFLKRTDRGTINLVSRFAHPRVTHPNEGHDDFGLMSQLYTYK